MTQDSITQERGVKKWGMTQEAATGDWRVEDAGGSCAATGMTREVAFVLEQALNEREARSSRPPSDVADCGVRLPLPDGPQREADIRERLGVALLPDPSGESGWQVYACDTVSNGKMEALQANMGHEVRYRPPTELMIGTILPHPQLGRPAPVIGSAHSPYFFPRSIVSMSPEVARFTAHAPADIAYLLKELDTLRLAVREAHAALVDFQTDHPHLRAEQVDHAEGLLVAVNRP